MIFRRDILISRLKRNHTAYNYGDSYIPNGILFKDLDKKIVNKDKIEDITYGPSISREWTFEQPIDNPEWSLQTSFTKKL